jgi:hypothetical protein
MDDLEVLRTLGDVPEPAPAVFQRAREAFEDAATGLSDSPATRGSRESRIGRHRRLMAAALAAIVIAGTTGGLTAYAARAHTATPSDTGEIRCYTVDSLKGGSHFIGLTIAASAPPGATATLTDAVATCQVDWQQGFLALGKRPSTTQLPPNRRVVPPLVACVLPNGIAAVFPDEGNTCQKLGISSEASQKRY